MLDSDRWSWFRGIVFDLRKSQIQAKKSIWISILASLAPVELCYHLAYYIWNFAISGWSRVMYLAIYSRQYRGLSDCSYNFYWKKNKNLWKLTLFCYQSTRVHHQMFTLLKKKKKLKIHRVLIYIETLAWPSKNFIFDFVIAIDSFLFF